MADRVAEILSEVSDALQRSESPDAAIGLALLCVAVALLRRKGPEVTATGDVPEWVTPEEAVREFRLSAADTRRLHRRWRKLDYCRANVTGGRGFQVNRRMLAQRLWKEPLG